jgi:hypothetical protein
LFLRFRGGDAGNKAKLVALDGGPHLGPARFLESRSKVVPVRIIRLSRRGNRFEATSSDDGVTWTELERYLEARLPKSLKVGVLAESTAPGTFKAVFDNIKLSYRGRLQGRCSSENQAGSPVSFSVGSARETCLSTFLPPHRSPPRSSVRIRSSVSTSRSASISENGMGGRILITL